MYGLGKFLSAEGYRVRGVILPGHGTEPADLNRVSRQTWLDAVLKEWQDLTGRKHYIGLSLGGIIGAYLTATGKISPRTLTMISAPVHYPKASLHRWVVPWLCRFKKFSKKYWIQPKDFAKYRQRGKYTVIPLHGSLEAYRLVEQTRPLIVKIKTPTLIIHSQKDPVVTPQSVDEIIRHIKRSQVWWSPSSVHSLLSDKGSEEVYAKIGDFVKNSSIIPKK
jgi:carboxylesterase